jgi:hypothetical protein
MHQTKPTTKSRHANLEENKTLGEPVGDISEQGWLIGFAKHAMWADSLLFPRPSVTFSFENLASSQPTL